MGISNEKKNGVPIVMYENKNDHSFTLQHTTAIGIPRFTVKAL